MPTTALTVTDCTSKWSRVGAAVTMAAADVANGNHFTTSNDVLVIAHNSGGSSRTVTITSQPYGESLRTGDVSAQAIAAGEIREFRLTKAGWADIADKVLISASHADVKLGVIDLTKPGT